MIPEDDLMMMRSHPQASDVYMIIQQPERLTEGEYVEWRDWVDYLWSAQINGNPTGDPVFSLAVNNGGPAVSLLSGMTVFIGSTVGEWDKGIVRLRGDQNVGPATTTLNIATSSDISGIVKNDDWVVVLDEFRLWQIFGRIYVDAPTETLTWYKDYNLLWDDIAVSDIERRLAMMPPVPIMGPHAVKFVDPPATSAQFWFDWSDSYTLANGVPAVTAWTSWGETNHIGGTWNSAAPVPGWQTVNAISGLRGFRVVLEVDDGHGTAATLPYRRGVRYVFTVRRPGESQPGDPPNAEAITDFRLDSDVSGNYNTGYWSASVTLYGEAASKYEAIPGALVILFTEDWFYQDNPYLSPRGITKTSVGAIPDRENILFVGRIADGSVSKNDELEEVSFTIRSVAEEASTYENYPIVIEDDANAEDWIDTPYLTVDRAIRYYTAWHTTLSLVTDVYKTGDTHSILAQDFMAGSIYNTLDTFLNDRLFARLLCNRYGLCRCEVNVQMQPFGSVPTLWTLTDGDWLDRMSVKYYDTAQRKAVEAGGIIYFGGLIVPKLSRAPGTFDKYRGTLEASNSLTITDQDGLNVLSGRLLSYMNHKMDMGVELAGNWRYCDISPQSALYVNALETQRGTYTGRLIIRAVSFSHDETTGAIFTQIETESEADDGAPGITVDIPPELPDVPIPIPGLPTIPWLPSDPVVDSGARIIATNVGVFGTNKITTNTAWFAVNNGVPTANLRCWRIIRDPWHWWTSGGTERTLWGIFSNPATTMPYYVCKLEGYPYGTWVVQFAASSIPGAGANAHITDIRGSIETEDKLYALGAVGGGFTSASYIIKTLDGGDSWVSFATGRATATPDWGVGADANSAPMRRNMMGLAQHSAGQTLYFGNRGFAAGLQYVRVTNGGAAATLYASPAGFNGNNGCFSFAVPYISALHNDSVGYLISDQYTGVAEIQRSDNVNDVAPAWTQVGVGPGGINYRFIGFGVCPDDQNKICTVITNNAGGAIQVYLSANKGATWTLFASAAGARTAGFAYITWSGTDLQEILAYDHRNGQMLLITPSGTVDVTGNLLSVAIGLAKVVSIDRDTMGGA